MAAQIGQTISSPYYNSGSVNQSTGAITGNSNAMPTQSTSPGFQIGGWYGGQQWNGSGWQTTPMGSSSGSNTATTASSSPSGGNSNSANLPSVDDLFGQVNGYYEGLKPQLQSELTAGQNTVNTQYGSQHQGIADQLTSLNKQLGLDTTKYNQNVASAYSQAQNQYNQLLQRNMSLYGGQGAGQAVNAILGQGYQQQSGQLADQNLQGQQQLDAQGQDITQWGHAQNNQLDTWKASAMQSLQSNFDQGISAINAQEGQTEQAKAQAKLGLLQQMVQQRQSLDTFDAQLRNQMAVLHATQNPGGISSYNPGNYASTMQSILGNINNNASSLPQKMGESAGMSPQQSQGFVSNLYSPGYTPGSQTQDAYSQLIG